MVTVYRLSKTALIWLICGILLSALFYCLSFDTRAATINNQNSGEWDVEYTPYKNRLNQVFADPKSDHGTNTPAYLDVTSGSSASAVHYAVSNNKLFLRISLNGDPRNENAGGFANDFRAIAQLVDNTGNIAGAFGINGSSNVRDSLFISYVNKEQKFVSNEIITEFPFGEDGSDSFVRVEPNLNTGTYFLDMQIPIDTIHYYTNSVFIESPVRLVVGTSTRGSLIDITKDSILNGGATFQTLLPIYLIENHLSMSREITKQIRGTSPPYVNVEQEYEITYTVTNDGLADATNVMMQDILHQDFSVLNLPIINESIVYQFNQLSWSIDSLPSLSSKSIVLRVAFMPLDDEPVTISGDAYVTTEKDGGILIFTDDSPLELPPAFSDLTVSITSDREYDGLVVTSSAPIIRGQVYSSKGPADSIPLLFKISDGSITRTLQTVSRNGVWSAEIGKTGIGLLLSGKTYQIDVYVQNEQAELGHDSATLRFERDELRITVVDNYLNLSDGYILSNNNELVLNGTTTAPVGSVIQMKANNAEELIEVVTSGRWNSAGDLSGVIFNQLSEGAYVIDFIVEGKFLSQDTLEVNQIYTSIILEMDLSEPEFALDTDFSEIRKDKPIVRGTGSNGDRITVILDIDGDGEFRTTLPDLQFTTTVSNGSWSIVIDKTLPRDSDIGAIAFVTDAAANSTEPLMFKVLTTAEDGYLLMDDYASTLTFNQPMIELSGTTNVLNEMLVLQFTDQLTKEVFDYYLWTDESGVWNFNSYNEIRQGDLLRNGLFAYTLSFVNSEYASLKITGSLSVNSTIPVMDMNATIPVIHSQQNQLIISGQIVAGDTGSLAGMEVKVTLTSIANSLIKYEYTAIVNDEDKFNIQEYVQLPSGSYRISANVFDSAMNLVTLPNTNLIAEVDFTAPTRPPNLVSQSTTENSIAVRWSASTDSSGVSAYHLYLNNVLIATVPGNSLSYTFKDLQEFQSYVIDVSASDPYENMSVKSSSISVRTLDKTAPTTPLGLVESSITRNGFTVTWNPSTDVAGSGVSGYDVFLDGTLRSTVTSTTFVFTGLAEFTSYAITVRARDQSGNLSALSQPVNVRTLDLTPPTVPGGLKVGTVKSDSIEMSWTASTDRSGISGYDVFVNGQLFQNTASTSITISDLKEFTTYQISVRARDQSGNVSAQSTAVSSRTLDVTPPSVPEGLSASSITPSGFRLSWTASTDIAGVTGYDVYLDGVLKSTSGVNNVNYTDLKPFQWYKVTVRAKDAAGNVSLPSTAFDVRTTDTTPPSVPAGLSTGQVSASGFLLNWNASTDNIAVAGYDVYLGNTLVGNTKELFYVFSGLNEFTSYNASVRAVDVAGNVSSFSSIVQVRTLDVTAPTIPSALQSGLITQNGFRLNWTASTDNAGVTAYEVFLDGTLKSTVTVNTVTFSDLKPFQNYKVTIVARDAAGNRSAPSNVLDVRTADTTAPSVPSGLLASEIQISGFRVNWTASTDNVGVASYDVLLGGAQIANVKETSYVLTNLKDFTNFTFAVRAIDLAGNVSATSSPLQVRTLDNTPPSVPTSLQVSAITSNGFRLFWSQSTDNAGVTGYEVLLDGLLKSKVSTNQVTFSDLKAFQTYKVSVRAYDAAGNLSAASNTIDVRTIDDVLPSVPSDLKVDATSESEITISWGASTDNVAVANYDVFSGATRLTTVPNPTYQLTGLKPYTDYNLTVRARDVAGNVSGLSKALVVRTSDNTPPSTPQNLIATNVKHDSFTVEWPASTDNVGIKNYAVMLNNKLVGQTNTTKLTVTGLVADTSYNVRVVASDLADNKSLESNPLEVKTTLLLVIQTPTNLKTRNVTNTSFDLDWTVLSDARILSYEIYVNNKLTQTVKVPAQTAKITGLSNFTNYLVKVRSVYPNTVYSPFSVETSVRTLDLIKPPAPTALRMVEPNNSTLQLSWNAVIDESGIASYRIFANNVLLGSSPTNRFDIKNANRTAIKYHVVAIDRAGNISPNSATFTYTRKSWLEIKGNSVSLDGKLIRLPSTTLPVVRNGVVFLPYKPLFDAIGLSSSFNTKTSTIIGSRTGYKVQITANNKTYRVNDKLNKTFRTAPVLTNRTVYIPTEFFIQELGYIVTYSAK